MPRPIRRSRTAPKYKWCGHAAVLTVDTQGATATSDIMLLCPSLGNSEIQGEVIVERIILSFSTRRLLTTATSAAGFLVAKQKTVPATGLPLEVLNPLETTADNFEFGNKDLLYQGLLSIPANGFVGNSGAVAVSEQVIVERFEFNGRRRLERLNHALTLTVTADVSAVLRTFMQVRTLLRFS